MPTLTPEQIRSIRARNPDGELAQALAAWHEAQEEIKALQRAASKRRRERQALDQRLQAMRGDEEDYPELSAQRAAVAEAARRLDANAARQQAAANRCAERVENVLRRIQRRRANLNGARAEIARQNRAIAELERKLQNAQANRERAIYVVREMEAELEALA